jgi:hypothetical protein
MVGFIGVLELAFALSFGLPLGQFLVRNSLPAMASVFFQQTQLNPQ